LAYRALSHEGVLPPFVALWNAGKLDEFLFSMYLQANESVAGLLLLGGIDPKLTSKPFHYTPIINELWYVIGLAGGVEVNGYFVTSASIGIIDSGTSYLIGPPTDIQYIADFLGAYYDFGYYIVNCSRALPDIIFHIGNSTNQRGFPVSYHSYVLNDGFGTCYLAMAGADVTDQYGNPMWIIGDVFMREYYTVFDIGNSRLGFAALHNYTKVIIHPGESTTSLESSSTSTTSTTKVETTKEHNTKSANVWKICGAFWLVLISFLFVSA